MPGTRLPESSSRDVVMSRLLASARQEIERRGILGLRVADVATGADSSTTQIYRYFGDRDGLLARVLGDMYEAEIEQTFGAFAERIMSLDAITLDDLLPDLPRPSPNSLLSAQGIRLQVLAAAATSADLRDRIDQVNKAHLERWERALDHIETHLAPGSEIDRQMFTALSLVRSGHHPVLLGHDGFPDEKYRELVRDALALS